LSQETTETTRGEGGGEMIGAFESGEPSVGIFWALETGRKQTRLLTAGCSLGAAEPYGDCLTFADGHYEVWERWRTTNDPDAALRAIVRSFEYEDWPRGRIVFDQSRRSFVLYADRKLMLRATIAQIRKRFSLSADQTTVETDFHYQSRETPRLSP
jgi:hypothetical protein